MDAASGALNKEGIMNIGDIGEEYLSFISAQAGIVINSPTKDRYGWDRLLEFDINNISKLPLDKQEDHIKCFIQVKTTEKDITKIDIKLSNWKYMIQQPLPFFILLVQINDCRKIENVYLSHIHEYWFNKVLKKLRENKDNNLNQHKMKYEAQSFEIIDKNNSDEFKNKLLFYIGTSLAKYTTDKNNLLKTLGYTDFIGKLDCVFNTTSDDLIDFAIGKIKKMPITKVKIQNDIRFNIPGDITEFENGIIEIQSDGVPVSIVLSNESGWFVSLDGKLFSPLNMFKSIPKEKMKVRIETDVLELVFSGQKCSVNYHFDLDKCIQTIEKLAYQAKVFVLLMSGCTFSVKRNSETFLISKSDKLILSNNDFNKYANDMNQLLNIEFIYNYLGLPKSDIIELNSILQQSRQINEFRAYLDPMCDGLELSFVSNKIENTVKELFIPRVIHIMISSHRITLVGYYKATIIHNVDDQYITKPVAKLLNTYIDRDINEENEYQLIIKHNDGLKILFVGD